MQNSWRAGREAGDENLFNHMGLQPVTFQRPAVRTAGMEAGSGGGICGGGHRRTTADGAVEAARGAAFVESVNDTVSKLGRQV